MQIRPLRTSDLEPLYCLYASLARMSPYYLNVSVGIEQFATDLTTTRYCEDEHWDADADLVLVAAPASGGDPVAFAHASFLRADARYSDLKAGAGMLRFAFAAPEHADAIRDLFRFVVEAAQSRACPELRAFAGYAPLFHNFGESAVSNAWPWVGRALVQEEFRTMGAPVLSMHCRLDARLVQRLPLPDGVELRYDWVTRVGERDETEGGFHLFVGDDRAAESMWHFGEKYVCGAGISYAHLFWLGTNPPYRGRGFGRILLRETLARAQEMGAAESSLR